MMTEKDLLELGFQKVDVLDEESHNGYDYYYYTLHLMEGLQLISSDSDAVRNNKWEVINWDWLNAKITDRKSIEMLKKLTTKWIQ